MNPNVGQVLDLLASEITIDRPDSDDVLAVLIRAILSQATSSNNRDRAFETLLDLCHGDWNVAAEKEVSEIEEAIRIGGLAKQKSKRIQFILLALIEDRGEADLEFLREFETDAALSYLQALPGVGPQSATFTLGWAAGADVCPINTGVKRVAGRLGWLTASSDSKAHAELHELLPEGRRFDAHMLMVRHARTTCGKTPDCERCVVEEFCLNRPST